MRKTIAAVFLLVVAFAQSVAAQSTGTLLGIVRDEQRVVVPGAQITATDVETKKTYRVISTVAGEYKLQLPIGVYSVTVELRGFNAARVSDVRINPNESKRLEPITLTLYIERDLIPIPLAPVPNQPSNRL